MKKIIMFLLFFILIIASIQAQDCVIKPNQRSLAILPDTASEESMQLFGRHAVNEFQTNILEKIMLSQATPVLVELSIWKRFTNKMKKQKKSLSSLPFAGYKVDNFLLCIPKKWQQQFPDTGFNLDQLQKVADPFALQPSFWDPIKGFAKSVLTLLNVYSSIVQALRTAIASNKNISWNIVLFGHGGPGLGSYAARTAGIPTREFKKLLKFLNNDMNTNILLYQTCYAGSKWLLQSYETNNKPDVYRYPIILTGLSEAPVYSWGAYRQTSIYEQFFQKIKTIALCKKNIGPLSLIAGLILQAITFSKKTGELALTRANNILQIRWPHSTQFKTVEIDTIVASARKTAKKEPGKELPVTTRAFILDTPYLDKAIRLTRSDHEIVSALPQKTHYIASITLDQNYPDLAHLLKKVLSSFTGTKKLTSSKMFLIDTVQDAKGTHLIHNVIVSLKRTGLLGLWMQEKNEILYTIGNQGYRFNLDADQPVKLDAKNTDRHLRFFEVQKKVLTPKA